MFNSLLCIVVWSGTKKFVIDYTTGMKLEKSDRLQ